MHLSLSSDTTYYDQGEYVLRTSRVLRTFSMVLYIIQRYPDSRPRSQLPLKYSGLVPVEPSSTGGFLSFVSASPSPPDEARGSVC